MNENFLEKKYDFLRKGGGKRDENGSWSPNIG